MNRRKLVAGVVIPLLAVGYLWVLFGGGLGPMPILEVGAQSATATPIPTIEVNELFNSPLDFGAPGYKQFWNFNARWIPDWTMRTWFAFLEDVGCSPTPCRHIMIVNENYDHGLAWTSFDCGSSDCLSNYSYYLYDSEWGMDPGDDVQLDLYWTDQPDPLYLSDLKYQGTITTTVPLYSRANYTISDNLVSTYNSVDSTIVNTFTITSLDNSTTTLEIRKQGYQWVPDTMRPIISFDKPHACSVEYPSGNMSGFGCVDASFSSSTPPFTAVITVTAIPNLREIWTSSLYDDCDIGVYESDGSTNWYLGNLFQRVYCEEWWWTQRLPIVIRND